jgi:hypothetical protein
MRPGETSDIAISLYASMPENHWAYAYYTDVPLAAPLLTPITVTSTTDTPSFVTVTAMGTDADRHGSATPSPEVDDEKSAIDNEAVDYPAVQRRELALE